MHKQDLPEYQCHKRVRACKIKSIEQQPDGQFVIHPAEAGLVPVEVPRNFITRHSPTPGGYLVQYRDNYLSFSPAAEFEAGYLPANGLHHRRETLINELMDVEAAIEASQKEPA